MKTIKHLKTFYRVFPVFYILYVILWIPIGFIISFKLSYLLIKIFSFLIVSIFQIFLPISINLFAISGRLQIIESFYYILIGIIYDIIILTVGLEYIDKINKEALQKNVK